MSNKTMYSDKAHSLAKGNAIDKVCAVLSVLSGPSPLRLADITRASGLNRVTALRILDTLCKNGFVRRSGDPAHYSLGPELMAMAVASTPLTDLRELVRPSLIRLAQLSGDVALLSVRSDLEALCIDRVVGDFPINVRYLRPGARRPLGVSAGGMALLAWLPKEERDAILDISSARLDPFPRISRDVLADHITVANQKGYVVMVDVVVDKLGGMAVPIRDIRGDIVAAISIVSLADRILEREDELAQALKREQARLSDRVTAAARHI